MNNPVEIKDDLDKRMAAREQALEEFQTFLGTHCFHFKNYFKNYFGLKS